MNRIAELRKAAGFSQAKFGEMLGAAQNTVSNWETGNREPDNERLKIMSDIFHVSIDYILGNDNADTSPVSSLDAKDQQDIAKELECILEDMNNDFLIFDGAPMDEESKELLRASIESDLRMMKALSKQKNAQNSKKA